MSPRHGITGNLWLSAELTNRRAGLALEDLTLAQVHGLVLEMQRLQRIMRARSNPNPSLSARRGPVLDQHREYLQRQLELERALDPAELRQYEKRERKQRMDKLVKQIAELS